MIFVSHNEDVSPQCYPQRIWLVDRLQDVGMDCRIILKWILNSSGRRGLD